MPRHRKPLPIAVAAALTLGAGLAVTALLFGAVSRLEYGKMALGFQQRANVRVAAIRRGLDEAVEVLSSTNLLFAAVTPVTREQFHVFTGPLLLRHPFIQAFNFHRLVPHAQRAGFEAELQRLVPAYRMREMQIDGQLAVSPARDAYYVVDYLEPMQGNEAAFGLDVTLSPNMREALEQALQSGSPSATGLLRLAQDSGQRHGFVLFLPVYRPGAPLATPAERRAALIGDTAAVIRANDLVQKTLSGAGLLEDTQLTLSVYAGAAADPAQMAYRHGAPEPARPPTGMRIPAWLALDYTGHDTQTFIAAGKPWTVRVAALPQPFLQDHVGSLSTLLGGILLSLMGAAFVLTLTQRSQRVQRLVDARTGELKLSNRRLNADIRARKAAERALQESEQRFRRLLALSSDWYWEQDAQLRFTRITGGFADKSHMPMQRYLGHTRWECIAGMGDSTWGRAHIATVQAHLPFSDLEYAAADVDGQTRWFNVNGEPLFDADGNFQGYRGTGSEITARKLSEQRIRHSAHHDVLTGLPNRSLLQDRLGQAIAYANRNGQPFWVLLIDLDRFKFVNDSFGHKAGDLLLQTVAQRLQTGLRETDTVARLAGDEFVAILGGHSQHPLEAAVVQRLMAAVAQPLQLEGQEFIVTCSIGVAVHTPGMASNKLIEQADLAMYCAKKLGRNMFQFYAPAMNEAAQERVRIEGALRNALKRGEFVLHYQPQLDLATGHIVGVEALIRWQHPELGMVAPVRFIGLAEETGLIVPIGAWVLRTACAQAQAWRNAGLGPQRMAVNLSARQFSDPDLLASIGAALADTGLQPACLELELTESMFMSDVTQAVELLDALKNLGVKLSIDDFGTGYSSFSYLRRFPVDVLKIDRAFIADSASDAGAAAIVVSIIALARNLKLRVIAEGVETAQQLSFLRSHGCDEMQGYYFSQPLPAAQFEQLLREGRQLPCDATPGQ